MQEQEIAKIFKLYNDYMDVMIGLSDKHELSKELELFKSHLRQHTEHLTEEENYLIEAKVFLKFCELCQKEK